MLFITFVKYFVLFGNNFKLGKDFKLKTPNKKLSVKRKSPSHTELFYLSNIHPDGNPMS